MKPNNNIQYSKHMHRWTHKQIFWYLINTHDITYLIITYFIVGTLVKAIKLRLKLIYVIDCSAIIFRLFWFVEAEYSLHCDKNLGDSLSDTVTMWHTALSSYDVTVTQSIWITAVSILYILDLYTRHRPDLISQFHLVICTLSFKYYSFTVDLVNSGVLDNTTAP